jgi:hypothetical protein
MNEFCSNLHTDSLGHKDDEYNLIDVTNASEIRFYLFYRLTSTSFLKQNIGMGIQINLLPLVMEFIQRVEAISLCFLILRSFAFINTNNIKPINPVTFYK